MGNATPVADLAIHLGAERDALRAFVALLETEQQALVDGHIEQLLELADKKTQSAHELNRLENVRKDKLRAHGVAANKMEGWLRSHARDSLQTWQDVLRLAGQAQQINRSNGVLIQSRMRHNQQALTVLHNAVSAAHGLYGPDGQPRGPSSGRSLGSG